VEASLHVAMLSVHTCPLAMLGGKKTGGMNVYVRDLSAELGRRGVAVDVFTRLQPACHDHLDRSTLGDRVRVIHLPAGPEEVQDRIVLHDHLPFFVESLEAHAGREGIRYDILHSHYWLSGEAALPLRERWGTPILQMFHTLGRMKNRVAQTPDERESPVRIRTEDRLVKQADDLIAATPAERVQLLWLYDADLQKIAVIPPGVDPERFHPIPPREARLAIGVPEDTQMLLFVGRIEALKGIDTLLRAIAILKEQLMCSLEGICLSIIGGDPDGSPEMARLKTLREELGIDELVTFLGAKDQDTLQYYYSAATVVIVPSHYESFGMVALEAMACGTPVIASEVGGLAYLIQDGVTGFHVPDRDPVELAERICLLLHNPALRGEMSAAAVQRAQEYAWSKVADRIMALYEQMLTQKERR
jgi:D-inositol-3-phosphate glycosyltransferase